ncbi:biosynthetic-type acetolactate synthase large subunit [Streptomyces achromogenes]|uniref:biosynthetic-type acetolactate synthase large subunit n=1 Tax=Streptomyces achromogenes TaxID=67255 RepID=UPI00099B6081|nr:biosynthetic-type acetolactate synthase large subunit [Streptomyces achromogenes]
MNDPRHPPTSSARRSAAESAPGAREEPTVGSGAETVLRVLEQAGVTTVFGIPGGAVLPLYQALPGSGLRHVLTRHEQAAGHAASGYARATGRLGVCVATSGPGATNLVTALYDAHADSVPVLAITGQVSSDLMGTDAFQEVDICSVVRPVTKCALQATTVDDIAPALVEAISRALDGRQGPVLVDITKDALQGLRTAPVPGLRSPARRVQAPPRLVTRAARLLLSARRPVVYAGGGVVSSSAAAELREVAETTGLPVVTTLMARGSFPDSHPLSLGMPGMHGTVPAVFALQEADVILAAGARFDDRVTGRLESFAPEAKVIHIDIDPGELSRKKHADVPLLGDCRQTLRALATELSRQAGPLGHRPVHSAWAARTRRWRDRYPVHGGATLTALEPHHVIERLGRLTAGPRTVYTTGVGQHQMWAAQLLRLDHPRRFITSGGAGTMGYALPAACGVQAALADHDVWAIDGDGSFQMTAAELGTCVQHRLPVKVAVINNGTLGMVRQWQDLFYDRTFVQTDLDNGRPSPDITSLAEAYGCHAFRCTRPDDVDTVIQEAAALRDRPVVIDFRVDKDALVWPMVPPGASNDDLLIARDTRPDFLFGG